MILVLLHVVYCGSEHVVLELEHPIFNGFDKICHKLIVQIKGTALIVQDSLFIHFAIRERML